mgnify:CR=1 FL=1|jgi:hypothetical protein
MGEEYDSEGTNELEIQNSILNSVKKMLGIYPEINAFDDELSLHINSVLASLTQMGIGPSEEGYKISSSINTWDEFLGNDKRLESVKSYVYMKVKLIFDPPLQSSVIDAFNAQIREFEYRNYIIKDNDRIDKEGGN